MKLDKQQILDNLNQVKTWIEEGEQKKEEKVIGVAIKNRWTGEIIFQSTKTTYKEALEESNANLSNADLSFANLSNADLSNADLSNADLSNANLSNADLSNADLSNANLSNADLSNANLRNADLSNANLRNAELCNTKFYGKGGGKLLKREQLPDFLAALGFVIEE